MTKKHFIALADAIRRQSYKAEPFSDGQIDALADFCASVNPGFMRGRWVGYIKGENGPCGGAVKA